MTTPVISILAPIHHPRLDGPLDRRGGYGGMNNTTAYTHLESFFLFRLLAQHGFVDGAFNHISEVLKNTPLVYEQDGYDAGRLNPDALQELSLQLLRDLQRDETDATDANAGGVSPTSRKRKLPNPPLPTLKEAQEQRSKLPALIDRLYARYREHSIRQIREEEQRYETLQREITELKKAQQEDQHIAEQQRKLATTNGNTAVEESKHVAAKPGRPNGQATPTPTPTPVPAPAPVTQTPVPVPVPPIQNVVKPAPATPVPQPPQPPQQPISDRKATQLSPLPRPQVVRAPSGDQRQLTPGGRPGDVGRPPLPLPNGISSGLQHPQGAPAYAPHSGPGTPQPQLADAAHRSDNVPKSQVPVSRPHSQQPVPAATNAATNLKWEPPYRPLQQTPVPSPRPPYTTSNIRPPYPPQSPIPHPQSQHPQNYVVNRQTPQPPSRTPTPATNQQHHPVLVPPQNAGQIPPSLSSLPFDAAPDGSGRQVPHYRPPSVPASGAPSPAIPATPIAPQQAQYLQSQTPVRPPVPVSHVPVPAHVSSAPVSVAQRAVSTGSGPGRAQHPPHPQRAQVPTTVPGTPVPQPVPSVPKAYNSPYNGNAQTPHPVDPVQRSVVSAVETPTSAPAPRPTFIQTPQPRTPLGLNTSSSHLVRGHGTRWIATPTPSTPQMDMSDYFAQPPGFEPISPPPRPAELPPKISPKQPGKTDGWKSLQKTDTPASKPKDRVGRSAQKAASTVPVVPTVATAPTAAPPAGEPSEDQEMPDRKIKNEVETPKAFEDAGDTTADESVASRLPSAMVPRSTKRKRQESEDEVPEAAPDTPPPPPSQVLWTRSFNKVSASALEQVTSHRYANMFANPVKDRDAPFYSQIVRKPQDLKHIRMAISAGQRAAAAAEKNLNDSDPSVMNVWLPISRDLVPPRGIINIAQLERELVHMFANAIMYAPDPARGLGPTFLRQGDSEDGNDAIGYEVDENRYVKDTRAMYAEVDNLLGNLRNEIQRNAPPPAAGSVSRSMSLAGGEVSTVEDEADEQQTGDTDAPKSKRTRRG